MPDKMVAFKNFTGGWNTDKTPQNLAENELELADNVDFSERGGLRKRDGVSNYSNSYGQQIERIFEWSKNNGNQELMAVLEDGSLVRNSTEETIFQLFGTHIDWFVLKNYLYIVDGNNYYRIDDETFNYEPVPEKDTSGLKEYEQKFEANLGQSFNLEYDEIKSGSVTVTLYSDPETEFDETTDYTINYDDGEITPLSDGNMEDRENYYIEYTYNVPSDNDLSPIRKCKYIIRHNKSYRIFAAGNPDDPSAIYYSEYNDPQYFKSYSVLYPTTNDGPVQGITVLDDMLLVFYQNSIWAWRGIDPATDAVWEKIPIKHGIYNHRTLETTQGALTFLDTSGIYTLNSSKGLSNITYNKVMNEIKNINNKTEVNSIYDSSNNRYMLAYSNTEGRNDKILVYDWQLDAFSRWTGLQANDFCYTKDGKLLMASDNYIKELNQNNRNNNVDMHVKFRKTILDNPYLYKLINNLFITVSNYNDDTKAIIHIDNNEISYNITSEKTRHKVKDKGVNIQVEFQDNSTFDIVLFDYGLEFKPVRTYREEL